MTTLEERLEKSEKTRSEIKEQYDKGLTPAQIIKELGINRHQYAHHSSVLRMNGEIGRMNKKIQDPGLKFYVRMGRMSEVFLDTDMEFRDWVRESSKHYGSVAEFVREIVLESYYNE